MPRSYDGSHLGAIMTSSGLEAESFSYSDVGQAGKFGNIWVLLAALRRKCVFIYPAVELIISKIHSVKVVSKLMSIVVNRPCLSGMISWIVFCSCPVSRPLLIFLVFCELIIKPIVSRLDWDAPGFIGNSWWFIEFRNYV